MGIRIRNTVGGKKQNTTYTTHSTGNIPSIDIKQVGLVSLAGGANRELEIINKWKELAEFVKDVNLLKGVSYNSTTYLAVDINGVKSEIQVLATVDLYVTGMVGLQVHGTLIGDNGCVDVEFYSAITEMIEHARENELVDL